MMSNRKILALIPARGGSKGILRKNIVEIKGRPLIEYSIEAAIKSEYISETFVSTEDSEIINVSRSAGASIIERPLELAGDSVSIDLVIFDALKQLGENQKEFDILILLQPTSPLRDNKDIDQAFDQFYKSDATALISVFEPVSSPYKTFRLNSDGFLVGLVDNFAPFMNRQDLPKTLMPNGAIYIIYIEEFIKYGSLYTSKTVPFLMSRDKSFDIDNIEDIVEVETRLQV